MMIQWYIVQITFTLLFCLQPSMMRGRLQSYIVILFSSVYLIDEDIISNKRPDEYKAKGCSIYNSIVPFWYGGPSKVTIVRPVYLRIH